MTLGRHRATWDQPFIRFLMNPRTEQCGRRHALTGSVALQLRYLLPQIQAQPVFKSSQMLVAHSVVEFRCPPLRLEDLLVAPNGLGVPYFQGPQRLDHMIIVLARNQLSEGSEKNESFPKGAVWHNSWVVFPPRPFGQGFSRHGGLSIR